MKSKAVLKKTFFVLFCLLMLFPKNIFAGNTLSTFNRAEKLFSEKKYIPALKLYEKVASNEPCFILAYQGIVKTYQALGDIQGALVYMETLFMENPNSAGVFYGLGYAQYCAKQYSQAKTSFQKAIELDPELPAAHNNVAAIYHFIEQDFDNARFHYEKAIELSRKKGDQRVLQIAQKNLANLPGKEKIEPITEALTLDTFVNMFIGLVEKKDEQTVKALVSGQKDNCEKAFDWFISQALFSYASGNTERENTMVLLASLIEQYYRSVFKSPVLADNLAQYRKLQGEEKASAAEAETLLLDGIQKQQQDMHMDAVDILKKALILFENIGDGQKEGQTLLLIGKSQRSSENYSAARSIYKRALTLFMRMEDEPSQALTLYLLGTTSYRLGSREEAIEFFKRSRAIYKALGDEMALQQLEKDLKKIHH